MSTDTLLFVLIGLVIYLIYTNKNNSISPEIDNSLFSDLRKDIAVIFTKFEENEKNRKEMREERSKKDDERLKREMQQLEEIHKIQRTLSGTKKRGQAGENILKEYFSSFISQGLIETNLRVKDSGEVEYAYRLEDGKYIPIDSKFPDVINLYNEFDISEDIDEQKKIKDKIKTKVKKHISEIKKYSNNENTYSKAVLALPDAIVDTIPELVSEAYKQGVIICKYSLVLSIVNLMAEQYSKQLENDQISLIDIEALVDKLKEKLSYISQKTETIDRGLTMIKNANSEIYDASNVRINKKQTIEIKKTKKIKSKK